MNVYIVIFVLLLGFEEVEGVFCVIEIVITSTLSLSLARSLFCRERDKRPRERRFVSCVDLFLFSISIVTEFHSLFAFLLVRLVAWIEQID